MFNISQFITDTYYVLTVPNNTDPCDEISITISGYNGAGNGEMTTVSSLYFPKGISLYMYERSLQLYMFLLTKRIFIELLLLHDYYRSDEYDNNISSIITFAILYFLNTVPSDDSSIPVTIQTVVTHNMLNITVFVNVRKSLYIHIILCSSLLHTVQETLFVV